MTKDASKLAFAMAVAFAVVVAAPSAQAFEFEAGGLAGANWNYLGTPTDPEGSYTFLWGSAFSGFGTLFGATGALEFTEYEGASIGMTADLLYGYHRGAGYADHTEGGRIDVLFTSHVLRIPLLLRFAAAGGDSGLNLGLGVEPNFGLLTTATIEATGIEEDLQPVYTTPTSAVAGVVALGYHWITEDFVVPIDARLVWNPFVPSSTEERFRDFQSPQEPGEFGVAFDWQILVTAGVRFDVSL